MALVAAVGWGLGMPESPLVLHLHGGNRQLVPGLIAFASAAVVLLGAQPLKQQT